MPQLPAYENIRVELDGVVGRLVLNRPKRLNSFTVAMWGELRDLGERMLASPGDVRALVVVGEGRAFSSGIDTSVFTDSAGAGDGIADASENARHADPMVAGILQIQEAFTWLEEVPFATIAAMRGYALGAGLQLALACDVRVAARGTQLGLMELEYGIIPDLGGTQRLPRIVGPGKAKEMIFTAARIDADEALRIGLVEHVVSDEELEEVAAALAHAVAARPPLAVRAAKHAVGIAMSGATVREGLLVEAEGQAACFRSDDQKEAIVAFAEGRPPVYRGQ